MPGTYVTDLKHFLNDEGELADMPTEARQLACFLVLVVDAVSSDGPRNYEEIALRCRAGKCSGTILARVNADTEKIDWHCPLCGHNGAISNWQNTKWDQHKPC